MPDQSFGLKSQYRAGIRALDSYLGPFHAVSTTPPANQSCDRIARTNAITAGEKRRPDSETSETSRVTSGSVTGCVRTPGIVGENSGKKQTPKPAATIIWIQSSRSL